MSATVRDTIMVLVGPLIFGEILTAEITRILPNVTIRQGKPINTINFVLEIKANI